MSPRHVILAAAVIALLGGCSDRVEEPPQPFVLTYTPLADSPGAALEGTLLVDRGCIIADGGRAGRFVLILPTTMTVQASGGLVEITDPASGIGARTGQRLRLGGGAYGPDETAFIEGLIGRQIPDPCRTGKYWLVSELVGAR